MPVDARDIEKPPRARAYLKISSFLRLFSLSNRQKISPTHKKEFFLFERARRAINMGIGDIVTEKKKQIDEWLKNQSTPVEIAAISAGSAVQGTAADFFFLVPCFCRVRGGDRSGETTVSSKRFRSALGFSFSD